MREADGRVEHHRGGGDLGGVDDGHRAGRMGRLQGLLGDRAEKVEAEEKVDRLRAGSHRPLDGAARDAHIGDHGAALLGQPRLVQPGRVEPVEMGGHLEDARHGDDAGATDAGHAHRESRSHPERIRVAECDG